MYAKQVKEGEEKMHTQYYTITIIYITKVNNNSNNKYKSSMYEHTHTLYLGVGPQEVKDGSTLGMEGVFEGLVTSAFQMAHIRLQRKNPRNYTDEIL